MIRKIRKALRKITSNRFYEIDFYPVREWWCDFGLDLPTIHNWFRVIVWLPFASIAVHGWLFWGKRPDGTG